MLLNRTFGRTIYSTSSTVIYIIVFYVFIFDKCILNHGTIRMGIFYSGTFLACPVINQKCLLFTFVSNVNIVLVTVTD